MTWPLLTLPLAVEDDIVSVRQRARAIADGLGFGIQDQTRIATAVSEIARNAYAYGGGGTVEFGIDERSGTQELVARVRDSGPGIRDLPTILEGRYHSETGLGIGITGARRVMDRFDLQSAPGEGTVVTLAKRLPRDADRLNAKKAAALAEETARNRAGESSIAIREQNRDLLHSLTKLAERDDELQRVNRELADTNRELAETNRGVVALYAELETQAAQLRDVGANLEHQVAARTAELAEANARLKAEAIERERVESDLRQSQKMEAVGQLTGGIAHDFNNLLTGIVGPLDLMRSRIRSGRTESLERYIEMAVSSATRAAALTHRLLAFARRQPLDPKPTDANALTLGMSDLLRRTISESIDLRIVTAADLWLTLCDPHQLENAILNLAINARDAMPDGGTLTISTRNCRSGEGETPVDAGIASTEYVSIDVTDSGTGMPPEVIARAFDPFFTTKPLGQGTGLGLSMIYGFARQSEGVARIESELGRGTSVKLFLPRHLGPGVGDLAAALGSKVRSGAGQTVLVVEDEKVVRDLLVEVLHDLGYRTLQAADGPSGLRLIERPERIDLLITDVGLPGLNGRQLADHARVTRPGLKVLFITGYAETAAAATGFLEPGMAMITKPFTFETLMSRVGSMIEDGGGGAIG